MAECGYPANLVLSDHDQAQRYMDKRWQLYKLMMKETFKELQKTDISWASAIQARNPKRHFFIRKISARVMDDLVSLAESKPRAKEAGKTKIIFRSSWQDYPAPTTALEGALTGARSLGVCSLKLT